MDAIRCSDAQPLIPAWSDGELSEAQAAPLRSHLLECRECRAAMQDLRALGRWFQASHPMRNAQVPPGFSARVARRAFAGDKGERGAALFAGASSAVAIERRRTLEFVLWLTSVAALLLIVLAIGLRLRDLPGGDRLQADDRTPLPTGQILRRLEQLNQQETGSQAVLVLDREASPGAPGPIDR